MIRVVKQQTAHQEHICDECFRRINFGEPYLRVVQFISWADIGMEPQDLETGDSLEIWKKVVRQPNTVILKTHLEEAC